MKLHALLPIIFLCLGLTACGPDIFYIPIDNKLGNAKPLSKTDDTIRVVVPKRIVQYVEQGHSNNSDWEKGAILAVYIGLAKVKTDDVLTAQGYKLAGAGRGQRGILMS